MVYSSFATPTLKKVAFSLGGNFMTIYESIYDLLNDFVFGGTIIPSSIQDSACSIVSTALCLFVVSIPFILVWRLIKLLAGD